MLIGAAGTDGSFVPEGGMGNSLVFSIDVQQAEASVPADLERELEKIKASEGGCGAIDRLAIGSITGAVYAMDQRAVLAAVAGDTRREALRMLHHPPTQPCAAGDALAAERGDSRLGRSHPAPAPAVGRRGARALGGRRWRGGGRRWRVGGRRRRGGRRGGR